MVVMLGMKVDEDLASTGFFFSAFLSQMESRAHDWIHAKPVFIVTRYRSVHIYITTTRDCIVDVAGEIVYRSRYS